LPANNVRFQVTLACSCLSGGGEWRSTPEGPRSVFFLQAGLGRQCLCGRRQLCLASVMCVACETKLKAAGNRPTMAGLESLDCRLPADNWKQRPCEVCQAVVCAESTIEYYSSLQSITRRPGFLVNITPGDEIAVDQRADGGGVLQVSPVVILTLSEARSFVWVIGDMYEAGSLGPRSPSCATAMLEWWRYRPPLRRKITECLQHSIGDPDIVHRPQRPRCVVLPPDCFRRHVCLVHACVRTCPDCNLVATGRQCDHKAHARRFPGICVTDTENGTDICAVDVNPDYFVYGRKQGFSPSYERVSYTNR
jgi:hypothetical protein